MLVSIIIIKLIINLISWYYCIILVRSTIAFQDWKYFGVQFDELENVYNITQK